MTTRVALDRVEAELRKLWDAERAGTARARTMTVVAICETHAHEEEAARALAIAAPLHGARTVLVVPRSTQPVRVPREGDEVAIAADVALHRSAKGVACAEAIRLEVAGAARNWIPDTVARLLVTDLPVFVWWVGDLPDDDGLLSQIALGARATVAVVNANDMDLRDLPVLANLVTRGEAARIAVADFCWQRLRTWQDMLARFFDDEEAARDLLHARSLRVTFQARRRDPEPVGNQAALFVGWLAARLGWSAKSFAAQGRERAEAVLARGGSQGGGEVRVTFEGVRREGLLDGALVEVELEAGEGRFRVHRGDDPLVVCREGEHPRVPLPSQCVRVHLPDDGAMLSRVLERPVRDPLFEASLAAAAAITRGGDAADRGASR